MKKILFSILLLGIACSTEAQVLMMPGDYADPTILKDGEDYYMTHSPFYYQPGFLIWHSRDLVNWEPICRAGKEWSGSAWAPELQKVGDTYYIYFPADQTNWVMTAKDIRGPWTKPADTGVGGIDPGLAVTPEGKRYLFTSAGYITPLTDDGLRRNGKTEKIYDGWAYPEEWETECMCLESPKITCHNGYYYMVSAQGGTAGPATSHMAVCARSKDLYGPWENSPYNPIVHTYSGAEQWWSKGHGTLVEGPDGQWWIVYHAYEKGAHFLGRQTLMEPVEWTEDGWFRADKGLETKTVHTQTASLSDDFNGKSLGWQWTGWKEGISDYVTMMNGRMQMTARGRTPKDGRLMLTTATDSEYSIETEVLVKDRNPKAGLLLFYNEHAYAGILCNSKRFTIYRNPELTEEIPNEIGENVFIRLDFRKGMLDINVSGDGEKWDVLGKNIDVSEFHHNRFGGFLALRPALCTTGKGEAEFEFFRYTKHEADDISFPDVSESFREGWFPLSTESYTSPIVIDDKDFPVVSIAAGMLADDIGRVTGQQSEIIRHDALSGLPDRTFVIAGTSGQSRLIDELAQKGHIDISQIHGKWESFIITAVRMPERKNPLLVIAGSDRRGTAYGLTSLSRAIGVSPWYWWADVTPQQRKALYIEPGDFRQGEPSVQYRGIFINDERFGGWSLWAERTFDKESGKVGPKTYQKVFELLLRLKGNLLWPAMHNGTQAFNADPENARLANDYAIVMGSSHCEQMLRNNEDEWKNVGTYGDFNYITNRQTMIDYWEARVKSNGNFENIYTLGLRGIHDYPMEGARTTEERTGLMQKAINDQRDIIRRNIDTPVEEVPQILCTYEEVLDAYHNGLEVPEDVTLLWSDDKHGYTRNLCNPEEQKRKGGAGIYYHLSYHGDPASWIWLSPLSPAFISTELTKAYTFGARKIWVFNVGDIKPAEKEISFAMDLAWDIDRWKPENAHEYTDMWAAEIFGKEAGAEIADIQEEYYRLMASGKDSHVYFIDYTTGDISRRLQAYKEIEERALSLAEDIPDSLQDAYFELVLYPVRGASLLNAYQLLSRRSLANAVIDEESALEDARVSAQAFKKLDEWTRIYNEDIADGKWNNFFCWRPYHWYYSDGMDAPICSEELVDNVRKGPENRFISTEEALSEKGAAIFTESEGDIPIWMEALTPVRNFSKAASDNEFCRVCVGDSSFTASATPINNIWHSPYIGPMWSKVGTLHLEAGENRLKVSELKTDARLDRIYIGIHPPFPEDPAMIIPASAYVNSRSSKEGNVSVIRQLGFSDGVAILPFDTPSYSLSEMDLAPYVEYEVNLESGNYQIEIRTLPTLHVYEGRDARYGVSIDGDAPVTFSIHTEDFSAEWRKNVLQGYSSRKVNVCISESGRHSIRICLLDPGIVLQEIRIDNK